MSSETPAKTRLGDQAGAMQTISAEVWLRAQFLRLNPVIAKECNLFQVQFSFDFPWRNFMWHFIIQPAM